MPPIILTTARLLLRQFTLADYADLCRLSGNAQVMRYVGNGQPRTEEQVAAELERILCYYAEHPGLGQWAIICREGGAFVGEAGLYHLDNTDQVEVGYRLLPEYWGLGIATEVARALVDYGFERMGLKRIVAVTYPDNAASRRVLEKAGLRYEGVGHYYGTDLSYYALTKS